MSTFVQKVEREVSLRECDLCGKRQNQHAEPPMQDFPFTETVEGSHGHDYTQTRVLHLCKSTCIDRIGQMISVLKCRREDPKWAKGRFGSLLETLDKLLDEP